MWLITGCLWEPISSPGMIVVAAHSLTRDGALVMNTTELKKAMEYFPGIDKEMGMKILNCDGEGGRITKKYGFLPIRLPMNGYAGLGIFQYRINGKPEDEIIKQSVAVFREFAETRYGWNFRLSFPGELNDRLLEQLPDNVDVVLTKTEMPYVPHMSLKDYYVEIKDLIYQGRRSEAITTINKLGLEGAEDTVDTIQREMQARRQKEKAAFEARRRQCQVESKENTLLEHKHFQRVVYD
jgi:hypothetical protein